MALMNAGYAVAYVQTRGNGTLGVDWYDAGRERRKIIACEEYLRVVSSFSSAPPLGSVIPAFGYAQSAGGPLLGYAVNTAPHLFRGVIFDYAFLDVVSIMSQPKLPMTVYEYPEWGNPKDREVLRAQMSYSPYQNIKAQDYPPHLFLAGTNDLSTPYWQIHKYAAKLRALMTNDEPILLRTAINGTHPGTPFGPGQKELIEQLGFLLSLQNDEVGTDSQLKGLR